MILAINQFGGKLLLSSKHPRKELLQRTGFIHADRMFLDDKHGNTYHVGYIVGGLWWTFYECSEWKRKA